jgi:SRSO17 transposase
LLVDESADEKAGDNSAGAGKQYNGRMGKVETSQVGVLLSYVNLKVAQGFWTWLDGKLFLPEGGGLRRATRRCGSVWASLSRGFSKPRWNWPGN